MCYIFNMLQILCRLFVLYWQIPKYYYKNDGNWRTQTKLYMSYMFMLNASSQTLPSFLVL